MNTKAFNIVLLSASLSLLASCGLKDGATAKGDPSAVRSRQRVTTMPVGKLDTSPIGGWWVGNCTPGTGDNAGMSMKTEMRIYVDQTVVEQHLYISDTTCSSEIASVVAVLSSKPHLVSGNQYQMNASDDNLTDMIEIIHNTASIAGMNATSECGISDWRIEEPRSIKGSSCMSATPSGSVLNIQLDPSGQTMQAKVSPGEDLGIFKKK